MPSTIILSIAVYVVHIVRFSSLTVALRIFILAVCAHVLVLELTHFITKTLDDIDGASEEQIKLLL